MVSTFNSFHRPSGRAERTLVTGATGLLGQHLVRQLRDRGQPVRVFVRSFEQKQLFPADVEAITGDIRCARDVNTAVAGCRYVFHCCCTHVYNLPAEDLWAINVEGTRHICDAVEHHGCEKLVFTSTISTLKSRGGSLKPDSNMPARQRNTVTKQIAEELVLARVGDGLPAVIVNPAFFVGPFDYRPSPFRLWVPLAIIRPVRFVPRGGFNVLGAADVARGHVWALETGKAGQRYPIVGENISTTEFISMVNRATGRPRIPKAIPDHVLRCLARGHVFDAYVAAMLCRRNYVDEIPCQPQPLQPLEQVVDETVRWFRAYSPLVRSWALVRYAWDRYT